MIFTSSVLAVCLQSVYSYTIKKDGSKNKIPQSLDQKLEKGGEKFPPNWLNLLSWKEESGLEDSLILFSWISDKDTWGNGGTSVLQVGDLAFHQLQVDGQES